MLNYFGRSNGQYNEISLDEANWVIFNLQVSGLTNIYFTLNAAWGADRIKCFIQGSFFKHA